jgi:hypothetical protein
MTYAQRGAHASHARERDLLLLTCRCGAQYTTRPDEPAEWCPTCTREQALRYGREYRARKDEERHYQDRQWEVVSDPAEAPFRAGVRLTQHDIDAGLELGAFVPGMRLRRRKIEFVVGDNGRELALYSSPKK